MSVPTLPKSERHKNAILAKAEAATPGGSGDLIYALIPPLALIKLAVARCERHLEELQDKARSAWNDDFRSRVEGWIDEEEARISDIKASIRQVEEWIDEGRRRLDGQ